MLEETLLQSIYCTNTHYKNMRRLESSFYSMKRIKAAPEQVLNITSLNPAFRGNHPSFYLKPQEKHNYISLSWSSTMFSVIHAALVQLLCNATVLNFPRTAQHTSTNHEQL